MDHPLVVIVVVTSTEYWLINKQGVSSAIIHQIRSGKPIKTTTIDTLCFILDCSVSDIIEYVKDE